MKIEAGSFDIWGLASISSYRGRTAGPRTKRNESFGDITVRVTSTIENCAVIVFVVYVGKYVTRNGKMRIPVQF